MITARGMAQTTAPADSAPQRVFAKMPVVNCPADSVALLILEPAK